MGLLGGPATEHLNGVYEQQAMLLGGSMDSTLPRVGAVNAAHTCTSDMKLGSQGTKQGRISCQGIGVGPSHTT